MTPAFNLLRRWLPPTLAHIVLSIWYVILLLGIMGTVDVQPEQTIIYWNE